MTIKQAKEYLISRLTKKYTAQESAVMALWLLNWATHMDESVLISQKEKILDDRVVAKLEDAANRHLIEDEPLQYIFGTVNFLDLIIKVRPPILIPRPETEYWCYELIKELKKSIAGDLVILDMCTGSGCIALALAKEFKNSLVFAVDKSADAINLAQENAILNGINNVQFIESDLFKNLDTSIKFDLIISNPPYINIKDYENLDPEVKKWEAFDALVAQENGLAIIKKIVAESFYRLKEFGKLVVEIGCDQAADVYQIFESAGFSNVSINKDLADKDRTVSATKCGLEKRVV